MELQQFVGWLGTDKGIDYHIGAYDILRFKGRVCVPKGPLFRRQILKEGHHSRLSIHLGMTKMYKDLKESFWWNGMTTDVTDFVAQCLHLSRSTKGHDLVWVIVDRLTKCAHFLPMNQKWSMDKLAELYVREVVRLHGVPESIVSDRV
ncbi:uncharacterized protein LOC114184558 [Vigna unguiculata]|uniref:uncharacterized protein LOC114184558 n=1 Tax=Vigna unguiculata TaxID=3917 RepID=UPI00101675A6|nr:uncharacterized protein LOC114184558 [Vigna unguiculata]